jgi:hypothetical protein
MAVTYSNPRNDVAGHVWVVHDGARTHPSETERACYSEASLALPCGDQAGVSPRTRE